MAPDCEWLVAFPCSFSCPPDLLVPYIQLLANSRLPYFILPYPASIHLQYPNLPP